jgi:hypothetical protein
VSDGSRDGRRRFAPGNKLGKGNPYHRRIARLRAELLRTVTPDDIRAIARALISAGRAGDVAAAKLVLERVCDKVPDVLVTDAQSHQVFFIYGVGIDAL